ncbi:ThuA domain-containing protein [uncultured Lacinutrix sp.]|uniref:ThuA domain-containing protein n=1 Tax=uncultured Lacinutrix sp. TaxID=574032 RepID=UPI00261B641D|nr:ThuA domain-containing protein [uncultured Lacinutrix sp.]
MSRAILYLVLIFSSVSFSQKRILIYHETNQFRHTGAINAGISMFEDFGVANNFIVDNSQNSNVFTTGNLALYDAVIFLNTSGNDETGSDGDLLSSSEKAAFENFILNGKGFIGIHAATDTYRDGSWDFYNELVGGIVQTNPNHTNNNYNANIEVKASHPIIDFLGPIGSVWNKNEEYYYWQNNGGQLSIDNTVLLEVEETEGPNGIINSYDVARPITWYKESVTYDDDNNSITPDVTINNIRSFYTALGHNGSDYSGNNNFRTMLLNATLWAIGNTLTIEEQIISDFKIVPNPVKSITTIQVEKTLGDISVRLYTILGKEVLVKTINSSFLYNNEFSLNLSNLNSGVYLLKLSSKNVEKSIKLIKK